ncbi:aminotransferase class I/II-fold pyridoxal phosphate-dependent enzyme [Amycolatopsis sp. NPDC059657]|uniref:aminotransferase class I/II-fold pyridoxal phosphate-dependent enzyme n=1 Tax=Amycolatopsis sp. NPDC059657 TaxID=3346899 RepID=UPI00366B8227
MAVIPSALPASGVAEEVVADRFPVDTSAVRAGDSALEVDSNRFARMRGIDLLGRDAPMLRWQRERAEHGVWPYFRSFRTSLRPHAVAVTEDGRITEGLNFGCQDYLSLSTHPRVHEAAGKALRDFGPIAAGALGLNGGNPLGTELAEGLATMLGFEHGLLFPTGWAAGYGTIQSMISKYDHVVLDKLAHNSLRHGAAAGTRNVSYFEHLDNDSLRAKLREIRGGDAKNAILVVTEGIFSMDSDAADLRELIGICREFDAVVMVDVAHDFGATGPDGLGQLGAQGVLGEVDLVVGAFSKSFATTGGFLVTRSASVFEHVRLYGGPQTFSSALTPVQLAVALEALRIIRSAEGERRRVSVRRMAERIREGLAGRGLYCMGNVVCPVIPVLIGSTPTARLAWRLVGEHGLITNLAEPPAVASNQARFRLQAMADHTTEDAGRVVDILDTAIRSAQEAIAGRDV